MTSSDVPPVMLNQASMRVLAHPTRLTLLGLLRQHGPQTAAQLGDRIDEAPGTVSYHLGKLASVALIREAPDVGTDRRERWWRSTHDVSAWEPADLLDDPTALAASTTLQRAIVQHYWASLDLYLDALPSLPSEWVRAAAGGDRTLSLTVEQLAALRRELEDVVERYLAISASQPDAADAAAVTLIYQAFRRP